MDEKFYQTEGHEYVDLLDSIIDDEGELEWYFVDIEEQHPTVNEIGFKARSEEAACKQAAQSIQRLGLYDYVFHVMLLTVDEPIEVGLIRVIKEETYNQEVETALVEN